MRERLVARSVGGGGPADAAEDGAIDAHLADCASCRAYELALADSEPVPPQLVPPPHVAARLDAATRIEVLARRAGIEPGAQRPPRNSGLPRSAWFARPAPISNGALVGLVLLAACAGFVLSTLWSPTPATPSMAGAQSPAEIPADQFEEASYDPAVPPPQR